jgi:hypothetical protein
MEGDGMSISKQDERKVTVQNAVPLVRFSRWFIPLILIAFLLLNCFGFCWSKFRFLSDQERIEIAVRRSTTVSESVDSVIEWTQGIDGSSYYTTIQDVIPYKNMTDFFALNPNCCQVSRQVQVSEGVLHVNAWECLSGLSPYFVSGKHLLRFREDGRVKMKSKEFAYYISSCGNIHLISPRRAQ